MWSREAWKKALGTWYLKLLLASRHTLPPVRSGIVKTLQSAFVSASGHRTVQVKFLSRYGGKRNDLTCVYKLSLETLLENTMRKKTAVRGKKYIC